jgi:hypothetical protein
MDPTITLIMEKTEGNTGLARRSWLAALYWIRSLPVAQR